MATQKQKLSPVFRLLRDRFWEFSPCRGDALHRMEQKKLACLIDLLRQISPPSVQESWSWIQNICIAPFRENISRKRSEWHVLMRNHTVLPATHMLIDKWNEPSCLYSPAAAHHCNLAGTHFLSHRGYEAELAWMGIRPQKCKFYEIRECKCYRPLELHSSIL